MAPDSWVKELAPSPVFCPPLSLSPFLSFKIILNLLSTDAGSQAHPLELEAPLGLTSLAGSPPLSLASKPARVDSHQPSTVSSGGGCSALPPPSQVALGTPDCTIAMARGWGPEHLQPAGGRRTPTATGAGKLTDSGGGGRGGAPWRPSLRRREPPTALPEQT